MAPEDRNAIDPGFRKTLDRVRSGVTRAALAAERDRKLEDLPGPRSLDDLCAFQPAQWAEWLRRGIGIWVSTSDHAIRSRAFAPIPMLGTESGPLYLGPRLRGLGGVVQPRLLEGIHILIASLTALGDTRQAGFAFMLVTDTSCARFESAIRAFLARDIFGTASDIGKLSTAMVQATVYCLPPVTAERIARLMKDHHVLAAPAAADIVGYIATTGERSLVDVMKQFMPDAAKISPDSPFSRFLLSRVVLRFGFEEMVRQVFASDARDDPIARMLRIAIRKHRADFIPLPGDLTRIVDRRGAGEVVMALAEEDPIEDALKDSNATNVINIDEWRWRK